MFVLQLAGHYYKQTAPDGGTDYWEWKETAKKSLAKNSGVACQTAIFLPQIFSLSFLRHIRSMINLESRANGVILPVHAQPGARKNGVTGVHAGRLKVGVTQAPEKGKANQALVQLLSELLDLKRSQISLLTGETSHHKRFLIAGVDVESLRMKLAGLLN
jgi:uncharacterized protein (TIGR00251 family)